MSFSASQHYLADCLSGCKQRFQMVEQDVNVDVHCCAANYTIQTKELRCSLGVISVDPAWRMSKEHLP